MSDPRDLVRLAAWAADLDARMLPATIAEAARACLLYGLAVGVGTRRARPALLAARAVQDERAAAGATCLLNGDRLSAGAAAFANAVLLSGRVQGDSHPCGHIGGVVIPASLVCAERAGASGALFLSALVAAYEVALRVGRDHAADLSRRGFRTTPCYGVLGASAAAGRIAGFDAAGMTSVLGLAVNFAGGLREYVDAGTEESPFQAGFAARNGLHAATLVGEGLQAARSALHGPAGFWQAFGAGEGIDYGARLVSGLGTEFEFPAVTYKAYPACQFLRGLIRGLGSLRGEAGASEPVDIEIRMNPFEADFVGVRYAGPYTSATQTVMSAPFCAALAWVDGTAGYDGLRRFDDARVLALVARIRIVSDPQRARYEPVMRVRLDDGRVLEWVERGGDADYRLTWDTAVRMTRQLFAEVEVPERLAEELVDRAAGIGDDTGVGSLVSTVVAATRAGTDRRPG